MKVYIVTYWSSPDIKLIGVFSTKEKAQDYIKNTSAYNIYDIYECEIDKGNEIVDAIVLN